MYGEFSEEFVSPLNGLLQSKTIKLPNGKTLNLPINVKFIFVGYEMAFRNSGSTFISQNEVLNMTYEEKETPSALQDNTLIHFNAAGVFCDSIIDCSFP